MAPEAGIKWVESRLPLVKQARPVQNTVKKALTLMPRTGPVNLASSFYLSSICSDVVISKKSVDRSSKHNFSSLARVSFTWCKFGEFR